ncbi:membrane protein [Streptomyces sp. NRRL S-118]|uniref:membrane protein n=1 Tax=Streptomyces sp. NRRL S-118 TaxID=1463881 RepID=UPI0004C56853|nr:membrane protein [Streptomyces sp. NRRL S-118]
MSAGWHVDAALAARYADGSASEPDAWSLEKHVERCGRCAALVSAAVRGSTAGPALAEVRGALLALATPEAAPAAGRVTAVGSVSAPGRVTAPGAVSTAHAPVPVPTGGPAGPGRARASRVGRLAWAAGPALRGAWIVAVLLVVAGALALAYGGGVDGVRPLLLALAPVVPLAGVAVSYGRHADPLHEIAAATPSGGLRLLLTRTAAVLAVCVPLLTAAGAVLPAEAGAPGAAVWLLPGLALTLAALALGSYVGCRTAAAAVAVAWLTVVAGPALGEAFPFPSDAAAGGAPAWYLSGSAAQGGWAAAAAVCAGLLALRRRSFDHLERW